MKAVYLIIFFCACFCKLYAQQDLRDPSYIYRLDDKNVKYSIQEIPNSYGTAVLFKGKLYKNVNFYKFYNDSALINYHCDIFPYVTPKKISKYTDDPGVKRLYVVGNAYSDRKIKRMNERRQLYSNKI